MDNNLGTPYLENLYLGNSDGRVLAFFEKKRTELNILTPYGTCKYGGKESTTEEMRHELLRYLGCNNYIVGFNVGWTLAALNLVLPGHRIVDIGTEDTFQFLCQQMAQLNRNFRNVFVEDLVNSYDRRIPATLFNEGLDLYPSEEVDPFREVYYTSAIYNVLNFRIKEHRERPDVLKVKMLVPIGAGTTPTIQEEKLLLENVSLIRSTPENVHPDFKCTSAQIFEILDVSPVKNFVWEGEHQDFLNKCVEFVHLWGSNSQWKEFAAFSYKNSYGDWNQRNRFAVNLGIPSTVVNDWIRLLISCINHHSAASIKELREYPNRYLGRSNLQSYVGRRLFTIWMDFAPRNELVDEVQPKPAEDPLALPENVMETTAAASSTMIGASTSTTTSAAETRSSAQPTQADESATHPTSQPPKTHETVRLAPTNIVEQFRQQQEATSTAGRRRQMPKTSAKPSMATSTKAAPATSVFAVDLTLSPVPRETSAASVSDTTSLPGSPAKSTRSQSRATTPTVSPAKATLTAPSRSETTATSGQTPQTSAREGTQTRSQKAQASPAQSASASTAARALERDE